MSAFRFRYTDILKALTRIILTSHNNDEVNEAIGVQKAVEKFNFIFLVIVETKKLQQINTVSKLLQEVDVHLSKRCDSFGQCPRIFGISWPI